MSAQLIILIVGSLVSISGGWLFWYLGVRLERRGSQGSPEIIMVFAFMFGIVGLVGSLLVGGMDLGGAHSCSVTADGLDVEHRWSYAAGCQVRAGDLWVNIDRYRVELEDLVN